MDTLECVSILLVSDGYSRNSVIKTTIKALIYKELLIASQQKYFFNIKNRGVSGKEGHTGMRVHSKK